MRVHDCAALDDWTQLGQNLWGRAWAWALVSVNDGFVALAVKHGDRNDLVLEAAGFDSGEGLFVGGRRESVGVFAGDVVLTCNFFRRFWHRVGELAVAGELTGEELRVRETPTDRGGVNLTWVCECLGWLPQDPWRAGHRLNATGNHDLGVACLDHLSCHRDRGHARCAQTIDGDAWHGVWVAVE